MNCVLKKLVENVRMIAIETVKLFDDRDYWQIQITSMADIEHNFFLFYKL